MSLGGVATQIYILFLFKRKMEKTGKRGHQRNICTNGRELVFTYREADQNFQITQRRFNRAIDELIDHGLIDIVESASGMFKEVTKYGLSDRWRLYDTPQFEKSSRKKRSITVGFSVGFGKTRKKVQQEEQDL